MTMLRPAHYLLHAAHKVFHWLSVFMFACYVLKIVVYQPICLVQLIEVARCLYLYEFLFFHSLMIEVWRLGCVEKMCFGGQSGLLALFR